MRVASLAVYHYVTLLECRSVQMVRGRRKILRVFGRRGTSALTANRISVRVLVMGNELTYTRTSLYEVRV